MATAKYLLRFDDLCPTMNGRVWAEIEELLVQRRLKPLLAVVPENRDPALQVDAPAGDFWDRARAWQERGWAIALHGFEHRYISRNAGLCAVRKKSEFAGLPAAQQREKLRRGLDIFARERLQARVWIAPGDTFDAATVALLPEYGIQVISAGYTRFPFVDAHQMIWVPQQMYCFRPAPAGVWTVCYHPNEWAPARLQEFRQELDAYGEQVVSLEDVLDGKTGCSWNGSAWLCAQPRLSRFVIRAELKLWGWWSAGRKAPQNRTVDAGRLAQPLL